MMNLNLEPYFENANTKYYNPKYIITILENILEKKICDIEDEINNAKIVVSEEQIKEYFEKKLEEENPELKKRIEKRELDYEKSKKKKKNDSDNEEISFRTYKPLTDKEIEELSQKFADDIAIERYQFEPYTLEYFNKYLNIVRSKAILLLSIIEKIGNKESLSIKHLMKELDIQLDKNGNISKEDIIRLITPTIYNIIEIEEKVNKANDLSTYLTFKMSIDSLYRNGFDEREIYPTKLLQEKNLYYAYIKGNVPLSDNQIAKLKAEQRKSMKEIAKIFK